MYDDIQLDKFISLINITKCFQSGNKPLPVLNGASLLIGAKESCAILGASGSGKSTLLNILGLLDLPDSGQYQFAGHNVFTACADQLAALRNRQIGFVFQNFNLIARMTALENVALPLSYRGVGRRDALQRAKAMLEQVGLCERATHRPADLSGGQRQRVAIARALVGQPSLILADEPTGNLDHQTAHDIMDLLLSLNREHGTTLVVVTHDPAIARRLDRQIRVLDSVVQEDRQCLA